MSKNKKKPSIKPRSKVSLNPLMHKSHVHGKSKKAERAAAKQELKKDLEGD
ncbi:MAG: hypothetical protein HKN50_11275 [Gammaproteobacteria bacterium]|nr:hypothetical protein [Gammaproteobacteria bacterium]